jgi:ABC-type glycerol-3-phosphate transport system substrate-binding protein
VVKGRTTLFDSPEVLKVLALYETMAREGLAYQITPGAYDDETALAQDQAAFVFRSSSGRTNVALLMEGDLNRWGMATIPQVDPAKPRTVLYGPNIVIFKTNADQQRTAWNFAKYFTSKETGVRWALGTGYLPIRKSAAKSPEMQKFWAEWPYNRAGFDCLSYAETEPALSGWQEVRALVENALTEILTGVKSAPDAAKALKEKADAVLARS